MHRMLFVLSLIVFAHTALGALGSGVRPTDGYATNGVAYARRGALGSDSYVVTNVTLVTPAYALVENTGTNLVDRAMNRATVMKDVTFVIPPTPRPFGDAQYRAGRSFVLILDVPNTPPPKISFTGQRRLVTMGGYDVDIRKGTTMIVFTEISEGEFLVESISVRETSN